MVARISRRAILGVVPAALAQTVAPFKKQRPLPRIGEFVRLIDPETEAAVVRLTALSSAAQLPEANRRFVSAKNHFLVLCSDRSGSMAPYHLDLRTGVLQQLADGSHTEARTLGLDSNERFVTFLDSGQVKLTSLGTKRTRVLAEGAREFVYGPIENDLLVLRAGAIERPDGAKVVQQADRLFLLHPSGKSCVFGCRIDDDSNELWLARLDTGAHKRLAAGEVSSPFWSPDAKSLLYLRHIPSEAGFRTQIMEVDLETAQEQAVSPLGQLACFSPNANATVFTGALRSKAQPNVTLLLRKPRREITLCEHHATDAATVSPVFSPDSRRVYFESDREGKSAVYSIGVEALIEPT